MLIRITNIICCILFCANVCGQNKFSGKVLNGKTSAPVSGASVYFNNTSIGTLTNDNGEFFIPNAINGEVIISSVGFERIIHKLNVNEINGKSYTFKLIEKETTLQDVLILPDATRKRYLKLFTDNFLGLTEEAEKSSISNLSVLNFASAGEKNAFKAFSDTPLTIINKRLGYTIYFDLVEFYMNEATGLTSFYGYTRYQEMGDKKRWTKNRKKAYFGSTLHFYRSLINYKLKEENFAIYILKSDSLNQNKNGIQITSGKMDIAIPVTASDIVKKDSSSNLYIATWKDRLMVQYYKNPASKLYLSNKMFMAGNLPIGVRSYLKINADHVGIDSFGILDDPLSVFYSGYWIYEKAANLLPYNYYPEND